MCAFILKVFSLVIFCLGETSFILKAGCEASHGHVLEARPHLT